MADSIGWSESASARRADQWVIASQQTTTNAVVLARMPMMTTGVLPWQRALKNLVTKLLLFRDMPIS